MPDRENLTPPSSKFPLAAAVFLIASALVCVLWFLHARGYLEDDAWIHLEFARSLAAGQGFAFNGHVVYGDTSPLWVFLLEAAHVFFRDWVEAGKALCVAGLLFALAGVFAYARSLTLFAERPLAPRAALIFAAAMVLLTVTGPYFGYWAFSGMEALTAAGLACWVGTLLASRQLSPTGFLLAAFGTGVSPLLRPEMSFFVLLVGLILWRRLLQMARPASMRAVLAGMGIVLLGMPTACWDTYALHTFGRVFPNTNAAKRAGPHDSVVLHLLGVYGFGFPLVLFGLLLLTLSFAASLRVRSPRATAEPVKPGGPLGLVRAMHPGGWLPIVWTAVNSLFYVVNHTYVQTRYVFVTAPLVLIALMALAAKLRPALYRGALAFGLLFGVTASSLATWALLRNKVRNDQVLAQLAQAIRALPPAAPVALFDIGEVAYLSQHPIIDTGGITRPGIIPYLADADKSRQIRWARGEGAQYYLNHGSPEPGAVSVWQGDLREAGWHLDPNIYRQTTAEDVWKLADQPPAPEFPARKTPDPESPGRQP